MHPGGISHRPRAQADAGRSNTGPQEHFEACVEHGQELHRYERKKRSAFYKYLSSVYVTVVDACANGEADTVRGLMKVQTQYTSDVNPTFIRDLLAATSGSTTSSATLTKRVAAIRHALMSGCLPAKAAEFFKKEGVERSYKKVIERLAQEQALKAASQKGRAGDDRDKAPIEDGEPVRESKKVEAEPLLTASHPPDDTATAAAAEVPSPTPTGKAVHFLEELSQERRPCNLRARLWFDGEQLYLREIWRPRKSKRRPSIATTKPIPKATKKKVAKRAKA
jgi:hypothetical protein